MAVAVRSSSSSCCSFLLLPPPPPLPRSSFNLNFNNSTKKKNSRINALFWGGSKKNDNNNNTQQQDQFSYTCTLTEGEGEGEGSASNSNSNSIKSKVINVSTVSSISDIPCSEWDACAADATEDSSFNPFLTHAFLSCLEHSGSAVKETGWMPRHLIAKDQSSNSILAVVPLYLKTHSYGEFVFDHSWANAYYSYGSAYYPKLQCCVPFTPVTGPRILLRNLPFKDQLFHIILSALKHLTAHSKLSSLHVTFPSEHDFHKFTQQGGGGGGGDFLPRIGMQYHWKNRNYSKSDSLI